MDAREAPGSYTETCRKSSFITESLHNLFFLSLRHLNGIWKTTSTEIIYLCKMRKLYVRDIPRCLKVLGPEASRSSVSWARHSSTPSSSHGSLRFHLNHNCLRRLQKYTLEKERFPTTWARLLGQLREVMRRKYIFNKRFIWNNHLLLKQLHFNFFITASPNKRHRAKYSFKKFGIFCSQSW